MTIIALLLQEVIMVVTISSNRITTMIGGVVEGVAHEVVGGAMDLVVEVEVMTISRSHHQVSSYMCVTIVLMYTFHIVKFPIIFEA